MNKLNPHLKKKGVSFIGFIHKNDLAGVKKKLALFGYRLTITADKYHKGAEAKEWVEAYAQKNMRQIIRCLKEHFKSLYKKSEPKKHTVERHGRWRIS